MAYNAEMIAMLEAQRARFASDDHLRREVGAWRDATPAERLAWFVSVEDWPGDRRLATLDDLERRFPAGRG